MKAIAMKNTLTATVLAVSAGLATTASAGPIDETLVEGAAVPSKSVSFSRAELATPEGRAAVEARIRGAAKDVCGPMDYHRAGGLSGVADSRECYHQAVSQALSQLNADQVAAID